MIRRNLLDLNVLIALAAPEHIHRSRAVRWFVATGKSDWGVCPLTESGFIRIATNPALQPATVTVPRAMAILQGLSRHPGYRYWPITDSDSWVAVTSRFASRIMGRQQITNAYLLGLAIKQDGVLVTFDRGLKYLAGHQYSDHVLVLE
jgi:uncharacterized protein